MFYMCYMRSMRFPSFGRLRSCWRRCASWCWAMGTAPASSSDSTTTTRHRKNHRGVMCRTCETTVSMKMSMKLDNCVDQDVFPLFLHTLPVCFTFCFAVSFPLWIASVIALETCKAEGRMRFLSYFWVSV